MASFIELIAKIKQKNNGTFKLVDAQDVECEDGKGLDEVLNEKLDKNQGIENAGKTMIVGDDGNLVVGDSSPKNVYTKEEVDYMLADKMDKPYVPIEITDNVTITDALAGNFKINKIKGNTYQNVEENIVPTPQRPVPINSRKTTITKINPNIFDFEKENDTSKIPDSGTYRSIRSYQLKPDTQYIFSWSSATVPAKGTLSFQIQNNTGTVLVSPFTYFNISSAEKEETGKDVKFTTTSSGIIKFAYNCTVATSSTTETYQQYWYTKILKNITLKEDVEYATEYVELRSLKETLNLFDINFIKLWGNYSDGMTILDDGTVKVTNNDATLWPLKTKSITIPKSANYTIKYDFETISGGANSGWISLVNMSNDNSKIFSTSGKTLYLDAGDYYVMFYRGQGATDVENNIVQYSNIVLVEGTSAPSTYVAPTVRDYKIVDHETKTAKIIRNIGVANLTNLTWTYGDRDLNHIRCYAIAPSPLKYVEEYCYCNVFECKYSKYDYSKEAIYLGNSIGGKIISIMANQDVFAGHTQEQFDRLLKEYINNPNAITLYALETPTEESIAYVETDTSEVGYSWQDTTSPSPTIKSKIKGVEEIDITVTGKNLFDIDYVSNLENWVNPNTDGYFYIPIKVPKGKQLYLSNDKVIASDRGYYANFSPYKDKNAENYYFFYHNASDSAYGKFDKLTKDEVIYLRVNSITVNLSLFIEDFKHLQIEVGDTPTSYEPYTEQRVNITPPQPLYSTVDGSIADEVDVEKGVYRYWLLKDKIENLATAVNNAQKHGNFQSYFITKVKDNSLKPITLLGNEDTRNLICNKCNVNLLDYINEKETFSLYVDKSAVFVGNINIERLNENTTLNIYNFIKDFEIVYPLLTPIEIPIPQEDLKLLKSLKTEQGVTNIFVGGEVKPTIEARYPRDLALVQQQLEQKILLISDSLIDTQAKVLLQGGDK